MPSEELQDLANRVNLGPHEHLITATDETDRTGRFVVKRPTMRDEIRIGVDYARLRTAENAAEPVDIDSGRDNMAFMVATLNVVLTLRPDWFPKDAGESCDSLLVTAVFEGYANWKDRFRKGVPAAAGGAGGAAQPAEPGVPV